MTHPSSINTTLRKVMSISLSLRNTFSKYPLKVHQNISISYISLSSRKKKVTSFSFKGGDNAYLVLIRCIRMPVNSDLSVASGSEYSIRRESSFPLSKFSLSVQPILSVRSRGRIRQKRRRRR